MVFEDQDVKKEFDTQITEKDYGKKNNIKDWRTLKTKKTKKKFDSGGSCSD